ncbi:MAG: DegT/DnrJ/EryC1/StrS family aminotransferase [Lachnospiraceae bacterium]|nr:DegT/DnrJ/EryC1/StrS family aminotransferase [Lachnospiraceae bacterium]
MIQVWNNFLQEKELRNFEKAFWNQYIMEGPVLIEFQNRLRDILGVKYAIGVTSGSAALALALMGIGIKPNDEVIVPDLTFIATANAAYLLGAKVVLAPTEKERPIIDLDLVDKLITDKTKAIITVDLNGRISWSRELKEKYGKQGIYIVDDACQAFMSGSTDERAGTQADIGCFSFGITKTLSTINGGLVVTNNKELYEKMKIMKTQGMESVFEGDSYRYPGFNFKLVDGLAAIGLEQLERLDDKIRHMTMIDEMYRSELKHIEGIDFIPKRQHEFMWMSDIVCRDRDQVRKVLKEHDIISRPLGSPLHTAPFLEAQADYRYADNMQKKLLSLPSGPNQDLKNVEQVINVLKNSRLY